MKQRESGFVRVILEPALTRIKKNQCPACGKPKSEWKRRTDWACCSKECTEKYEDFCIVNCNKIKTKQDYKDIAKQRKVEKTLKKNKSLGDFK